MLDADQYDALVTAYDGRPMLQLYVLLLGEAGLRADSEALHLMWSDIDLTQGSLRVTSGRNGHRTKSGRGKRRHRCCKRRCPSALCGAWRLLKRVGPTPMGGNPGKAQARRSPQKSPTKTRRLWSDSS